MKVRLDENLMEIRNIQEELKRCKSVYRRKDLERRLRKLRNERSEAIQWLRKGEYDNSRCGK